MDAQMEDKNPTAMADERHSERGGNRRLFTPIKPTRAPQLRKRAAELWNSRKPMRHRLRTRFGEKPHRRPNDSGNQHEAGRQADDHLEGFVLNEVLIAKGPKDTASQRNQPRQRP